MAAVQEPEEAPEGTLSILNWYDITRPMHIDLVGDYAGKELFMIEGDSLLRVCFEDERIDFEGGFQLLHAVYVVERFLENLVKRHCQFHIGFFDENAELCVPTGVAPGYRPRYLLARAIIKRHLSVHLPTSSSRIAVGNFPSLDSTEFRDYLHVSPIHFVMAHDGAHTTRAKGQAISEESSRHKKQVNIVLRGMIWAFNTHQLNVALINRIEFVDSKVFTSIVENFSATKKLKMLITHKFVEEIAKNRQLLDASGEEYDEEIESDLSESQLEPFADAFEDENEIELGESYCLAVYGVSRMLKDKSCDVFMASAFTLHTILLKQIPLSQRRLPKITFDEKFESKVEDFLARISTILVSALQFPDWTDVMDEEEYHTDAIDLVDGRLFRVVIQAMCDDELSEALHGAAKADWSSVAKLVKDLTNQELSVSGSAEPVTSHSSATEEDYEMKKDELAVLPFSNAVFDKHLECISVATDDSIQARLGAMKIYRETTHWHNHKKPLNPKQLPAAKISKWKNPLRTNQFYMKEMTSYAASLTASTGKVLEPETITVGPKQLIKVAEEPSERSSKQKENAVEPPTAKGAAKKGTKKAAAGLSRKEQMIADNKERKGGNETEKAFAAWTEVMKGHDVISDSQDRYLKTLEHLGSLDSVKRTALETDINTYILQSLLNWWTEYCRSNTKSEGYHVVALIWTTIRVLCTSKAPISEETVQHMTKICTLLGISDAMNSFKPSPIRRKLSFAFKYPATPNLKIEGSQTEFQLSYCGPYMDRMLDAKPDPRVSSFVPDGWQRDVLDQLDADKSVFVVAPTSAGKTFISFYAMEQVLRADNDGVLVYVAPTKALVNQIAAEVQGRFSKRFPLPGKGVWAIHTRDYRVNNSTGCQILVTVPHILQIMLLSPSNSKSWAPRVRRIIFDEVHSIGQSEEGVVWEQLLLLAPCPIIALSATVGNPDQFNDWLTETQKSLGSDMKMIQHKTRYSDLRKYMYQPPNQFKFSGLGKSYGVGLGLDGLEGFDAFHPVASLVDKSRGMPDDLALEPRDCLTLWQAMCKVQAGKYKVPEALNPEKALPKCIRKVDIFAWEKSLKKTLLDWMNDRQSPFDKVVESLSTHSALDSVPATPTTVLSSSSITNDEAIDTLNLDSTTLPLLYQLHRRRALPAILFNYDRSACERIAMSVLEQLEKAEKKWKQGPAWRKHVDGYEKWKEQNEKKARKPAKPAKKSKGDDEDGGSKLDRMREGSSDGASIYDSFDPDTPQDGYTFANPKVLQKSELDSHISSLRRKNVAEDLIKLLQRGIGVHHAGMNRKYRQCVEMLFRKGFLRVVIATGTLSLGINMPCATVVFSGDSVFLTALNFRQASGRSGRRGFDLLGNVVFQGISQERASRLLSSRLPDMTGHFPITTTLVLRLFTLLTDSKNSAYAVRAIDSLLSQPRLYLGGQSFKEQVLHHLRFSIEYLRRNELLGPSGEPVNFTSAVSHLYFTENSSFAFHALLRGGYFHKLCDDIDTKRDMVLHQMLLVLSHLFGRRVVREVEDPKVAEKIKRSPSVVYLPPMPEDATAILREHNKKTLDIFSTYAKTFAGQHIKDEERHLPLTHTPVGATLSNSKINHEAKANGSTKSSPKDDSKDSSFEFLHSLPTPHARSAFVALSGLGDDFTTIEDLCSSTREGVFLEAAVIPHLEIYPDEKAVFLNAYLLDFFMHGALEPLEKANGIRKSDVWFVLNDFSMILATICTSLAVYLGMSSDGDAEMLDIMGTGDAAENEDDDEVAATTTVEPAAAVNSGGKFGAPIPPAAPARKKKVVDDWDAGEDALVAEEDYLEAEAKKGTGATDDEEYEKLLNVYKAFRRLKTEFDEKFMAIWA